MVATFTETQSFQRVQLFELLDDLTERIKQVEQWLESKATGDAKVQLLLTHKGIGLLSALAVVHTLETRFIEMVKKKWNENCLHFLHF
jgi:hypothetical protein